MAQGPTAREAFRGGGRWPRQALRWLALPLLFGLAPTFGLARTVPLGANLERFENPFPVHWLETRSAGAPVRMAYMDLSPTGSARGRVAALLHGKNFCAATWRDTATSLAAHGYRVIVPDQIGFCKSSKPAGYQYSIAAIATLTRDLLHHAGGSDRLAASAFTMNSPGQPAAHVHWWSPIARRSRAPLPSRLTPGIRPMRKCLRRSPRLDDPITSLHPLATPPA